MPPQQLVVSIHRLNKRPFGLVRASHDRAALGTHARTVDLEQRNDDGCSSNDGSLDTEGLAVPVGFTPWLLEVSDGETGTDYKI